MPSTEVYLGLGSNVGDRAANLSAALSQLASHVHVAAVSGTYETEPVGFADQAPFLNLVCRVQTAMGPAELLAVAKEIERQLGRGPTVKNGPRTVDIDILLFGDLCLCEEDLVIPHPRMPERSFVLVPLAEIAGDVLHPVLHKTIRLMMENCQDRHWIHAVDKGAHVSTIR